MNKMDEQLKRDIKEQAMRREEKRLMCDNYKKMMRDELPAHYYSPDRNFYKKYLSETALRTFHACKN